MPRPIVEWIYDHRWAITPNALETIVQIASQETTVEQVSAQYEKNFQAFHGAADTAELQAIQAIQGEPLSGARRATLRGNVAVIPVLGPIFPRSSLFMLSGGTSVAALANDLKVALDSSEVESIVLNIDSPGGEITGISEFSDMLYNARDKKNIISYVYGMGASAAYWIGSSAGSVLMSDTAEAGSIGVVALYRDTKERDKKAGVREIEIVSSVSPNKRPDVATAEGNAQIQRIVDELADIFVAAVARNRGAATDDVLANFGKGGMLVGSNAVENGLADGISSLEAIIDAENGKAQSTQAGGFYMTLEELKANHPEIYKAAFAEGAASVTAGATDAQVQQAKTEAATAERERIQGIHSLDVPGHEALVSKEMFTPEATASSVAVKVLAAQAEARGVTAANQQADAENLAGRLSGLGQGTPAGSAETTKAEEDAAVSNIVEGAGGKK